MIPAGAHRTERPSRRVRLAIVVVAPAGDGPIDAQPARMIPAGAHRTEHAAGRVQLPVVAVAPTADSPAGAQPARMPSTRAHRTERPEGNVHLLVVLAPAGDRPIDAQSARMGHADAHGPEPLGVLEVSPATPARIRQPLAAGTPPDLPGRRLRSRWGQRAARRLWSRLMWRAARRLPALPAPTQAAPIKPTTTTTNPNAQTESCTPCAGSHEPAEHQARDHDLGHTSPNPDATSRTP